jgi:hypothetical protein
VLVSFFFQKWTPRGHLTCCHFFGTKIRRGQSKCTSLYRTWFLFIWEGRGRKTEQRSDLILHLNTSISIERKYLYRLILRPGKEVSSYVRKVNKGKVSESSEENIGKRGPDEKFRWAAEKPVTTGVVVDGGSEKSSRLPLDVFLAARARVDTFSMFLLRWARRL